MGLAQLSVPLGFKPLYWVVDEMGGEETKVECGNKPDDKYSWSFLSAPLASEIGETLAKGYVTGITRHSDGPKKFVTHWHNEDDRTKPFFHGQNEAECKAKAFIHLVQQGIITL